MKKLIEPKNTIEVLQKYGFSFSKRYGQNFLVDAHVLAKILNAAEIGPEDTVLEIGPGIGAMTQALSERAGSVYAVEIDDRLIPILSDTLSECDNVTVIHGDILKTDIQALAGGARLKVVANLPYYITTPILMDLLERDLPVDSVTVMVQKEVAERIQASPGGKDYGALTLAVRFYADVFLAANVPPNCFIPRPDVSSAVITLKKRETPAYETKDKALLFRLIRAGFANRRKTLMNNLRNAPDLSLSKERAEEAVRFLGKGEQVRGEALDLSDYVRLSNFLSTEEGA